MAGVPIATLTEEDRRVLLASARQLGIDLTRTARAGGWPRLQRATVTEGDERVLDELCSGFGVLPPARGSDAREALWESLFAGVDSVTTAS